MNFIVRDGAYYMTSYGKAQKVLNIRRTEVGVMVESGGAYAELKGVMVRGDCELIEDPDRVAEVLGWLGEGGPRPVRPAPFAAPQTRRPQDHPAQDHQLGPQQSSAGVTDRLSCRRRPGPTLQPLSGSRLSPGRQPMREAA